MNGSNKRRADEAKQPTTEPMGENLRAGLRLLRQTYKYAQDAGADLWDFALEIDKLYETGLTISDLRWLIAKGFAQHGRETSFYGDAHRSFRPSAGLNFENATCLVLTPRGATLANHVSNESAGCRPATLSIDLASLAHVEPVAPQGDRPVAIEIDGPAAAPKPHWDRARRELLLGDTTVKRFRVPARNQETILCVFEEEGWPEQIDDPLPIRGDVDPQTRLHDAINRLNGHQTNRLLCFHGNGNGTGVSWEVRDSEWPQKAREGTKTDFKLC